MKEFSAKYLEFLKTELAGINLTRIQSDEEFYQKQIVDSVQPLEESKVFSKALDKTKLLVDIGFGGGFPILPLANQNPECQFIGMEARAKKAKAVDRIREHLQIDNAKLLHQRFEMVNFDKDAVVTFKAVGKVEDLLPLFTTSKSLTVFFYKGPKFYELENIESLEKDWEIVEEHFFDIDGTDGRMLIGFKNKNVLRGTRVKDSKKLYKELVNLSDLL
jgi:16S rRNA (guanine527-N7)-methyltransferase